MGAPTSILRLRAICQREKLRRPDDLTRKHRMLSIYATWLLVRTPVTADQVTVASIASGLLAGALLAAPGLAPALAGCALLYVSFLLDQVDGEVARYRRKTSLRGVYLDELRHLVVYSVPVFALGFEAARRQGALWPLAVSFGASLELTLARIEERLPALIFGERVSLPPPRSGGGPGRGLSELPPPSLPPAGGGAARHVTRPAPSDTPMPSAQCPVPSAQCPTEHRRVPRYLREALRVARTLVANAYEALAHQVLILFWILAAVLLDRGFGFAFAQAALLVLLLLATSAALLASFRARLVPGALEADSRDRASACVAANRRVLP